MRKIFRQATAPRSREMPKETPRATKSFLSRARKDLLLGQTKISPARTRSRHMFLSAEWEQSCLESRMPGSPARRSCGPELPPRECEIELRVQKARSR